MNRYAFWSFSLFMVLLVSCKSSRETSRRSAFVLNFAFIRTDTVLDASSARSRLNASEPHITINRRNPAQIVGGSILDNVYRTADTGRTWDQGKLRSPYGVYGDPVLISDDSGRVYYFHLASGRPRDGHWLEGIVMQNSDDGGRTWSDGVLIGRNGTKQQDKPWPAIHRPTGRLSVAWTEFDRYGSTDPADRSRILISFSDDRGRTWTKPVQINDIEGDCRDDDRTVEGAVPLFDRDGNVYVVWAFDGYIWMDRSTDGGRTWGKDQIIATQEAGWNFDIDGIYRANGLPSFVSDEEENFYVVFGDKSKRTGGDIKMIRSADKGRHWTDVTYLGPTERDQFFPAVAFDRLSKRLLVLYYDRSRTQGHTTQVYLSAYDPRTSEQTGLQVGREDFTPVKMPFFGDYIGLDTYRGITACIWTEIRHLGTQIHVAVLKNTSASPAK